MTLRVSMTRLHPGVQTFVGNTTPPPLNYFSR